MDKLLIRGGHQLLGTVDVAGAKNAALPELCAALLTEEPVEEAGLTGIREAHESDAGTGTEQVSFVRGIEKTLAMLACPGEAIEEGCGCVRMDVLVGEVQVGLHVGEDMHEIIAEWIDLPREAAG
jgi:hypothetical protein